MADIARPVKHSPEFAAYRTAERILMNAVCLRFGLHHRMPDSVEEADYNMLLTEYRDLMPQLPPDDPDANWHNNFIGAYSFVFDEEDIWSPKEARERFIERHYELGGN